MRTPTSGKGLSAAAARLPDESIGASALDNFLVVLICALLVWRLLVPTEGSVLGETLWITLAWPLVLALWGMSQFRRNSRPLRCGWLDVAVWTLVGGHVVASLRVWLSQGEQRSALNMLWEWLALGISFFLVRQILVERSDRGQLLQMLVAVLISLAGLGIWQHHYGYRQMAAEYERISVQVRQLEQWEATPPPALGAGRAAWETERNRLQMELYRQKVPLDKHARLLWEQRIKESSEPLGMFALANTFAGILLCGLLLLAGGLVESWNAGISWTRRGLLSGLAVVLAYCLLLTKSRTAYVGLLSGVAVGAWGLLRAKAARPDKVLRWGLALFAGLALLAGVAWATGGVDRLVLSESGKSLRYRGEYWRSTWRMLHENPLDFSLGVGSGNFRQHYLRYKLPESSEEIADPHNMLLDVWANGGLLGLVGLLAVITGGISLLRIPPREEIPADNLKSEIQQLAPAGRKEPHSLTGTAKAEADSAATSIAGSASSTGRERHREGAADDGGFVLDAYLLGGGLGFLAAFLANTDSDSPVASLALGWAVTIGLCGTLFKRPPLSPPVVGAALVGLLVHLLGAGGIGMPAITQFLLVLLAAGPVPRGTEKTGFAPRSEAPRRWVPVAVVCAGMFGAFACFTTASRPVSASTHWLDQGEADLSVRRDPDRAEASYVAAAEADPLSPAPWEHRAALAFQRALGAPSKEGADAWFHKGVELQRGQIARDPFNSNGYKALGDWCIEFGQRTGSVEILRQGAEAYRAAADRYPHHAGLQQGLARAESLAGNPKRAREAARRALELQAGNVRAGHLDKQLSRSEVEELERLAEEGKLQRQESP